MKKLLLLIGVCVSMHFMSCDHVTKKKLTHAKSDSLVGNVGSTSLLLDSLKFMESNKPKLVSADSIRIFGKTRPRYDKMHEQSPPQNVVTGGEKKQ